MLVYLAALAGLAHAQANISLEPFSSDGCSLFPDASLIDEKDWCMCCFEHDVAYWQGGSESQRHDADSALQACVLEKTDDQVLARVMYEGVRLGGSPYFYNWYRWGYGWPYGRFYQKLNAAEQRRAKQLVDEYLSNMLKPVCAEQHYSSPP